MGREYSRGLSLRHPHGAGRARGRIAPALAVAARRALAAEGISLVVATVMPGSRAARANRRRVGYEHTATAGWIGIPPLRHGFFRYVPRSRL